MNKFIIFPLLALTFTTLKAQNIRDVNDKPKLVVGIVVDQMRPEYLYRYWEKYEEGGFKRLLKNGFNNKNTHFNYIPTKTAAGHASVYSGTTPAVHGIIANGWYDRQLGREKENIEDIDLGEKSPQNMLVTTITDELQLSNQKQSKVIGISLKDRGAILPVGHLADGAYWYDNKSGDFVSSSFYQNSPPSWVNDFNSSKIADSLLNLTWETLLPIEQYTESGPDNTPYEEVVNGKLTPEFPYDLENLRMQNDNFDFLPETPFGNTITTKFALKALVNEQMGKGDFTDFIAISYSSTDKVGHAYGPFSVEVEDTYLRLDKEIAQLLNFLDSHVGEGNYLLFLTSDHGVVDVPKYSTDNKIPSGLINEEELEATLNNHISNTYGQGNWVQWLGNEQVYLDRELVKEKNLDLSGLQEYLSEYLLTIDGVAGAYPASLFHKTEFNDGIMNRLQRGYHRKRSGDVLIVWEPAWAEGEAQGTTHGSGYSYDTHAPLIWYGWNIKPGVSFKKQSVTDIAPTISMLLKIRFPNGTTGEPILEVLE